MNDLASTVLATLLATSCQLVVPFVAAWLLDRLLPRRAWPELRLCAWSLVALKLALPPTLGTAWHAPLADITSAPSALLPAAARWTDWLLLAWAGGVALHLAAAVAAHRRTLAIARGGAVAVGAALATELRRTADRLGLRRLPSVLVTDAPVGTFVCARPRSLLVLDRRQLLRLDAVARRHLLLHELAHVRRRDAQLALLGTVLGAVWWFHPLARVALRRLHALRELCCDQTVVRALGGDPRAYRRSLLAAAGDLLQPRPMPAHAFLPHGSLLLQRLRLLERPRRAATTLRRAMTAALILLLAVACVPMASPAPALFDPATVALNDLPGCLPRRFVVLAALARSEAAAPPTIRRP